jgi:hypothetical protein
MRRKATFYPVAGSFQGARVVLEAIGRDEQEAINKLEGLLLRFRDEEVGLRENRGIRGPRMLEALNLIGIVSGAERPPYRARRQEGRHEQRRTILTALDIVSHCSKSVNSYTLSIT